MSNRKELLRNHRRLSMAKVGTVLYVLAMMPITYSEKPPPPKIVSGAINSDNVIDSEHNIK